MSSVRRSSRRRLRDSDGFTLVEVLVALTLLGVVAAAVLPLLLIGARASTLVKFEALAKNVAQERLEQMRQLSYQVDRQNGPFIDLLDKYYPDRTPAVGTGAGWVASTATNRLPGEPTTGAFYRVVFPDVVPGTTSTQTVASQFLRSDRVPVADAAFANYSSATSGTDAAPSYFLGVTVVTTWEVAGKTKSFEVFTQITDQGSKESLIASQARATVLRVDSAAPDASALSATVGEVNIDGRLGDGSSAAVKAEAGRATRGSTAPLLAANQEAFSPATAPAGTPSMSAVTTGASCGYGAFGRSAVAGISASTDGGLPKVPVDVGTTTAPATTASSALMANSGGGACGTFGFGNLSTTYDPALLLDAAAPLVKVRDQATGSGAVLQGKGWVNASVETAASPFVAAGASASMTQEVHLLPATFVTDGGGVVSVQLQAAGLTCLSTGAAPTASYTAAVRYWNGADNARQTLVTRTWSSGSPSPDPLATLDLAAYPVQVVGGVVQKTLADYVGSWSFANALSEGSTNGVAGLDAAIRVTTKAVRLAEPASSIGLRLGVLSCVADDNR